MLLKTSWWFHHNILFICLYATSSSLYDLHTFLLHFWRFCLTYGIWPSLLRSLHKSKIYTLTFPLVRLQPRDSFGFIFVFVVLVFSWSYLNIMKLAWLLTFGQCVIQIYVYNCVILMMKLHQKKTTKSKDLTVIIITVFCNNYINQPLSTSTNS